MWWPIVVLLFMDPSVVEPAIQEASNGVIANPREYLEKIIQVWCCIDGAAIDSFSETYVHVCAD